MLNIYFGNMEEAIYDPSMYFRNQYEEKWITDEISKRIIKEIDNLKVIDKKVIESPVLGSITPNDLSGSAKTLILIAHDKKNIFNATTCGDDCASLLFELAKNRKVTINLRYIMDFGKGKFKIRVKNSGKIANNMKELLYEATKFV